MNKCNRLVAGSNPARGAYKILNTPWGVFLFLYAPRERVTKRHSRQDSKTLPAYFGACEQNSDKVYWSCNDRNSCPFNVVYYQNTYHMPRKETRTYTDRAEYMKLAVIKRRKKVRDMALEYKGGACQICGYNKSKRALSFHHINPDTKEFGISYRGFTRSWDKTRAELDKCILLCMNCHMEVHDGITKLPIKLLNKINFSKF